MKYSFSTYRLLILSLFFLIGYSQLFAQEEYYQFHLEKGKEFYSSKPPLYGKALEQFDLARNYVSSNDRAKLDTLDNWNIKTRNAIVVLYKNSERDKNNALEQSKKAKIEAENARMAKGEAQESQRKAEKALAKTTKIVNAFYFYDEQFALAFKNNKYGFINKEGEVVIDYKYEEAAPFDYTGLARVKRINQLYFLDSKEKEYPLSMNVNGVKTTTTALDLSNLQLTEFPASVISFKQLKILLLNGNEFRRISPSISQLKNLSRLYLYFNELKTLPPAIGSLTTLNYLDVSINDLSKLPDELCNLANLRDLILYDNSISKLPENLGSLKNLTFLDVSNNLLVELPQSTDQLQKLKVLSLGSNQLNEVPVQLQNLTSLRMLDLGSNQITVIPEWIGDYKLLTHLHLRDNLLEQIPVKINQLDSLKELIADHNNLSTLPAGFNQLENLKVVDLSTNNFSDFPDELVGLSNLSSLYLSNNFIGLLPSNLSNLTNLKKLDIDNNQLNFIPGNIVHLTSLESLDLGNNQLLKLPTDIGKMPELKVIDLRGNYDLEMTQILSTLDVSTKHIIISAGNYNLSYLSENDRLLVKVDHFSSLPPELFSLKKLVVLDLANCKDLTAQEIKSTFSAYTRKIIYANEDFPQISDTSSLLINVDMPIMVSLGTEELKTLAELSLSNEELDQVPAGLFDLTNLETLNLSNNKLKSLPEGIKNLTKLTTLYLQNNPIDEMNKLEIAEWLPEGCEIIYEEIVVEMKKK